MTNDFRYYKLGTPARFALAGLIFLLGTIIAIYNEEGFLGGLPGVAVIIFGSTPLWLRAVPGTAKKGKQKDPSSRWQPVETAEIDRFKQKTRDNEKIVKKASLKRSKLFLTILIFFIMLYMLLAFEEEGSSFLFAVLLLLFFMPGMCFGTISGALPSSSLFQKLELFNLFLMEPLPKHISAEPSFLLSQTEDGKETPINARYLLKVDKRDDILGLQLSITNNKVQGTSYQFLYGVLLTKNKTVPAYTKIQPFSRGCVTVEKSEDSGEEVGVIVIRHSGYETTPEKLRELRAVCLDLLAR